MNDTPQGVSFTDKFLIASTYSMSTLLDGSNVRLNGNIESDMNVNWIKFKNFLSLY
jgi:hypothetical protein